jgi:hypothetical protein
MILKRMFVAFSALLLFAACSPSAGEPTPSSPAAPTAAPSTAPTVLAVDANITPVSLTAPGGVAADGIAACGVGAHRDQVQGIAVVAPASVLPHYVPLTGDEPEIKTDQPAFVVLYSGTIRLPLRGQAVYSDITGATCVFIDGWPTWFSTGPWVDPLGNTGTPLPAPLMDKKLPPPLP